MPHKDKTWLDQTGLNLLRIVFASYFMAVSLGLVNGLAYAALFTPLFGPLPGEIIGSTTLFILSLMFMVGLHLRLAALSLALFVFCSSLAVTLTQFDIAQASSYWRDLAMVAALLLSYSTLDRRQIRNSQVVSRRKPAVRRAAALAASPRRVEPFMRIKAREAAEAVEAYRHAPDHAPTPEPAQHIVTLPNPAINATSPTPKSRQIDPDYDPRPVRRVPLQKGADTANAAGQPRPVHTPELDEIDNIFAEI